jgi:hypothetical protein
VPDPWWIIAAREVFMSDQDHRAELARLVMQILDEWEVEPEDQPKLLGLPDKTRVRALNRYRQGDPLPEDATTEQRLSCLLSIHKALLTVLPHNTAMVRYWVTSPNPRFANRTPLEVMLTDGLAGMKQVVEVLTGRGEW